MLNSFVSVSHNNISKAPKNFSGLYLCYYSRALSGCLSYPILINRPHRFLSFMCQR
ncbi:hypothetical protein G3B51_004566 [Salmonella enterica]|uniref:Uncharacterized protein n=1 Tax=Salmonella enterica TaxID=28901 RepID=A0A742UIG1_SALER|nr:hypothetical protein [Salmonella enterica subsp. enterica]EDR4731788.1 hypothetical protein [Salmonella enterica subsp. enterica serovar 4,[5],12:b:-]EDS6623893.1 hypothetical protein [Salmonella enterica subsp. enterica serovar Java]EDV1942840.1 hypothetical protein [Salmonella enterica subsp. enterica serovar Oranienburg]EDV4383052.1 hypothetical protein [Salmonella enterica subsp. enterica serovar Singapore]EEG5324648.1 hypothetical protein [Salmonella enterica]EGI6186583.1 hypothetical